MAEGVVIVCTSNRAPWSLSPAGAHEDMFAHFIGQLTSACPPFELSSSEDYRRLAAAKQAIVCCLTCIALRHLLVFCQACSIVARERWLGMGLRGRESQTAQMRLRTHQRLGPVQVPEAGQHSQRCFHYPLSEATTAALEAAWHGATGDAPRQAGSVPVMFGRSLQVGVIRPSYARHLHCILGMRAPVVRGAHRCCARCPDPSGTESAQRLP